MPDHNSTMDTSAAIWYNRSGHVIDSTHHRLSAYGSMLPVLVVEAISNEDVPVQSLSIKITDQGWACLVSGTTLFVWKFNSGPSRTCPCYELELPPSDLTFKADLVTLITAGTTSDSDAVSVLAVSPEGIVRFWSNILHETCFTEAVVQELQGQECSNLCPIGVNACLLATTTNSLLLISMIQNEPVFRTLKAPVGVLSGLGKKFTSFIFGGMPVPQAHETKSFIRIFKESDGPGRDFVIVYTMAGSTVQQWQILSHESEVLRAEKDLDHILKDRFLGSVAVTCDPRQANVLILDAGLGQEKQLLLLVASLVPGDRIRFAIATFVSVNDSFALTDFHLIADPSAFLSVHNEETLLNLKLLLCPDRSTIYVYDDSRIFFIRGNAVVDMINFEVNDDGILGAGCCDKIPLLFTCRDGLVTISSSIIDYPDHSILSESVHGEAGQPQSQAQTDKFRRAFYLFSRNEKEQGVSIISDAFDVTRKPGELAHVILNYVEEISDANFTPDEVWEESVKRRKVPQSFSSQDIFVTRQLENKIATVNLIIELIDSFPAVGEHVVSEIPLLLNLNDILEKQMVALSAKSNWMEFLFLTEPVLLSLADHWNSTNKNFVHDEFFRHSSRVHEMIPALIKFAESKLDPSLMSGEETLQLLMSTAELVINIMSDVFSRRNRLPSCLTKFCNKLENFASWDSVVDGTRCHLIKLFSLLENPGCRLAATSDENKQNRDCVFDRMTHLADILLSSFSYQFNFMKPSSPGRHSEEKIFQEMRSNILRPLIAGSQFEKAIFLAEKYQDFDALIEISELTNKPDLLNKYACMFSSRDFTGHLFKWYMERGRQEMVLQSPHMFSQMLEGHSDLHWLQQIEDNDFSGAAKTLKSLAIRETENLPKKRTILSLCKLSQLIAPDAHPDPDVDHLLSEITFQDFSETIQ